MLSSLQHPLKLDLPSDFGIFVRFEQLGMVLVVISGARATRKNNITLVDLGTCLLRGCKAIKVIMTPLINQTIIHWSFICIIFVHNGSFDLCNIDPDLEKRPEKKFHKLSGMMKQYLHPKTQF